MQNQDALKWNGRYTADGEQWLSSRPRKMLLDYAHLLPKHGVALDAAAGVALHGLFLAERGLHVIALDISEVGLRLAKDEAKKRGVWVETAVYDLSTPWLPAQSFDVITNFRFLERATFPIYRQALRPGGLIFFETFVKPDTLEAHPHFFLEAGELRNAFASFQIIHHAITQVKGDRTCRLKTVEQLVAQKNLNKL